MKKSRFHLPELPPMLQLHLGVLLLGGSGLFAKLISLSAIDIIAYRSFITAVVIFVFLTLTGSAIRLRNKHDYKVVVILGLLAGVHWMTYFTAIQKTSVAVGMIALFTYPVITVILDPLLRGERPALRDVVISILVLFGISLLFPSLWQSEVDVSSDYVSGVLIGIVSAVCFALRNIGIQRHFKGYSSTQGMLYQFTIAGIICIPFIETGMFDIGLTNFQLLILFAIFFSAMAHILFAGAISATSAKSAGLIACLQPLYGIVLSLLLLAEVPSLSTLIGGAIILVAAIYETTHTSRAVKQQKN